MDAKDAAVVLVEDNADNLLLAMDLLQELGVKYCNSRASGRQMFKLLEKNSQVDLILLDIQIPYEDGYAILRQLRASPTFRQIKVVAVTANVMSDDLERARQAGFDGFIGKPIGVKRFPQQIQRILHGESVWEP